MKFTKQSVAGITLPEGKSDLIVFDDALPGFGLRVRGGGSRNWVVQYQIGGKQHRMSLGRATGLAPEDARKRAGDVLARVRLGENPQAAKLQTRSKAALTLGAVVGRFLERQRERVSQGKLRDRYVAEQERHLARHWRPLHGVQIDALDRATIAERLPKLAREHGASAADHARTALSGLFTWAMKEGLVEANPVASTNRPAEPSARDRVLTNEEFGEIWRACRDDDYGRIVRLLMLTGQRREEIAGLSWDEVDLEAATITLPASRTKNRRVHVVPLSDEALALLPPRDAKRPLVFGQGEGAFSGFSRAKKALDERILENRRKIDPKAKPMPVWRLHDLRRTVATGMADLGVAPHVIEAILNHVSGHKAGVAGIYNKSVYASEKRSALVCWGQHIRSLGAGATAAALPLRPMST